MKKKLFSTVAGAVLAISTATSALAASRWQSSCSSYYPHYHGFRYCTSASCAPSRYNRPQSTAPAQATAKPQATATPQATSTSQVTSTPQTTAAPQATSTPQATASVNQSLGKQMLDMVNEDRAANGLKPLTWSDSLAQGAMAHSQDMSQSGYFSHTSPTYGGFSARLKAAGLSTLGAGENIALYGSVEKAQAALMASEGHRANILKSSYTHCGIGIVYNAAKGGYYITQWFARMG